MRLRQMLAQERYDLNVDIETVRQRLLRPGGYFVGYAHTIKTHYDWIFARFPRPMAHAVYALDFLCHRVALKRSGLGGRVVHTYKFRTMHPYSEYLQQYMYDLHGLQKGGKIENDFRMTTWGKVMRKLWLDELPMLYNWVKGDFGLTPFWVANIYRRGYHQGQCQGAARCWA